jgi:hypothetical protein
MRHNSVWDIIKKLQQQTMPAQLGELNPIPQQQQAKHNKTSRAKPPELPWLWQHL